MAILQKTARRAYPSDATDAQWEHIEPFLSERKPTGRPPKYCARDMFDAMMYVVMTGCQWRALPHDLPPWTAVYKRFRLWVGEGKFKAAQDALREKARLAAGREAHPSAGCIDSQSVKASQKGALANAVSTPARRSKGASGT